VELAFFSAVKKKDVLVLPQSTKLMKQWASLALAKHASNMISVPFDFSERNVDFYATMATKTDIQSFEKVLQHHR